MSQHVRPGSDAGNQNMKLPPPILQRLSGNGNIFLFTVKHSSGKQTKLVLTKERSAGVFLMQTSVKKQR